MSAICVNAKTPYGDIKNVIVVNHYLSRLPGDKFNVIYHWNDIIIFYRLNIVLGYIIAENIVIRNITTNREIYSAVTSNNKLSLSCDGINWWYVENYQLVPHTDENGDAPNIEKKDIDFIKWCYSSNKLYGYAGELYEISLLKKSGIKLFENKAK